MMLAKRILISLKAYSGHSTEVLKLPLSLLSREFKIIRLSSVYRVIRAAESLRRLRDIRSEEQLDGIAMVILAETDLTPQVLVERLKQLEAAFQLPMAESEGAALGQNVNAIQRQNGPIAKSISIELLVYDQDVVALPGVSLPHPEMHLHPEEIIPAVEVWAEYVHPILGIALKQIARNFVKADWGEFITQGEALLDF